MSAPRTLVVAGDRIGPRMAGPSIRALEMARALAARGLDVVLAAPGEAEVEGQIEGQDEGEVERVASTVEAVADASVAMAGTPDAAAIAGSAATGAAHAPRGAPFRLVGYDARGAALREALEAADAVVVQGLTLAHFPFLDAARTLVVDLYDPFVLETLHARRGESPVGRARSHAADLGALLDQLRRGDYFVCASEVQRDLWLGALTAAGRINPATYDADPTLRGLVDVVPFGLPAEPPVAAASPVLRGVVPGIGPGDRIVLWGGGIWDWFDPLTLLRAVAEVDAERGDVRLVFMGTQSPSLHAPKRAMAARARALAAELGLLGRSAFFLDGWVPYAERGAYLLEADLGASTHLEHLETRYAFRTRLLDAIWAGLPMLVTEGDVLAERVAREGLGRTVPPEDVAATAAALRALLDAPGGKAGFAARFDAVRPAMTWHAATEPLARFAAAPHPAADRTPEGHAAAHGGTTPVAGLPARALELAREGGPLLVLEEAVRYARWKLRPR